MTELFLYFNCSVALSKSHCLPRWCPALLPFNTAPLVPARRLYCSVCHTNLGLHRPDASLLAILLCLCGMPASPLWLSIRWSGLNSHHFGMQYYSLAGTAWLQRSQID